jgi:hypothetical protein
MTVKFKIGFTIDAETLFSIVAKFLPLENLAIEEVVERPRTPTPRTLTAAPLPPRRRRARGGGKGGIGPNLAAGVNRIVVECLSDGQPHRAVELKALLKAQGYADSGIGSRLDRLREHKVVFQPDLGLWQLTEAYLKKENAA